MKLFGLGGWLGLVFRGVSFFAWLLLRGDFGEGRVNAAE